MNTIVATSENPRSPQKAPAAPAESQSARHRSWILIAAATAAVAVVLLGGALTVRLVLFPDADRADGESVADTGPDFSNQVSQQNSTTLDESLATATQEIDDSNALNASDFTSGESPSSEQPRSDTPVETQEPVASSNGENSQVNDIPDVVATSDDPSPPIPEPASSEPTDAVANADTVATADTVAAADTAATGVESSAGSEPVQMTALPTTSESPEQAEQAERVLSILRQNCHSCHGEGGTNEGGMNYISDLRRLVSSGKIKSQDKDNSVILQRILSGDMPPDGASPRPSAEDVEFLSQWIVDGAKVTADAPRTFITIDAQLQFIDDDLRKIEDRDKRFQRYITITHLWNSGRSDDELQTYRLALAKLLNSLSWERELYVPQPIDPERTVFRVDIRDLRWKATTWMEILSWYPYGYQIRSALERRIAAATDSELSVIRADWFVATASRPPLYHQILEIPESVQALQGLLRIDFRADVEQDRVARAGFNQSGISAFPRIIERHQIADGVCWVSYDFSGSSGDRNFFANPLHFSADGSEIIFNLPNGLQAYFLADATGTRIDRAPTSIVKDPGQNDGTVVNGISCIHCHAAGIIPKRDEVRLSALANPSGFREQIETIKAIYPDADAMDRLQIQDSERYAAALLELGIKRASVTGEPIFNMAMRFSDALDARLAAAELNMTEEQLSRRISSHPELQRQLGILRVPGGTVKRDAFEAVFGATVELLRLGRPFSVSRPAASLATNDAQPLKSTASEKSSRDWYSFKGSKRWPSFLERSPVAVGREGLRGLGTNSGGRQYIRTTAKDFLTKDFLFEIVFAITKDDGIAYVGIGEGRSLKAGDEPGNSVNLRIHPPISMQGEVGLSKVGPGGTVIGRLPNEGLHRVIIRKLDKAVTFTIDVDNDGESPDDIEQTIPDIGDFAPFLNSKNCHVFFGGGSTFQQVRLTVGAASHAASPAAPQIKSSSPGSSSTGKSLFDLSNGLTSKGQLTVKPNTVVRTRLGDYLEKDFQFDVTFVIPEATALDPIDRSIVVGIGEGTFDRLREVERCVRLKIYPLVKHIGDGQIDLGKTGGDGRLDRGSIQVLGAIRKTGTHKLSVIKSASAVTFKVDMDNDGESPDDIETTIPDFKEFAPYLHSKNGFLFFGGGGATFTDWRVTQ